MASRTTLSPERNTRGRKSRELIPTIDTTQARSNIEVVRMSLQELGWKEIISSSSKGADIYWNAGAFEDGNRNLSVYLGRVNKFPGMRDLLAKSSLTRALNAMQTLFPDEYDFYPRTWFLPEQREKFEEDARLIHQKDRKRGRALTTFIVKPSDGSEGAGIYLIRDPSRCNAVNRPYVAQEYVDRPLLIDGLKFDIRIYVLILHLDPLEIFLYDEGLARFATIDYEAPSCTNLHQTFMHLTNYSLNKRSATYKHAVRDTETDASKRKLSTVWIQLTKNFSPKDIQQAVASIEDLINKTILAILPELRIQYAMEFPNSTKQNRCFQILGFDILLTDQLKPILLEVNSNPSLRIDFDHTDETGKFVHDPSPMDIEIKKPLIIQTLKLVIKSIGVCNRSESNDVPVLKERTNTRDRKKRSNGKIVSRKIPKTDSRVPMNGSDSELANETSDSSSDEDRNTARSSIPGPISRYPSIIGRSENAQTGRWPERLLIGGRDYRPANSNQLGNLSSESVTSSGIRNSEAIDKSMNAGLKPHTHWQFSMYNPMKSIRIIYPSEWSSKYEPMFLLENVAFIYAELVVRRGYKAMTSRPFRYLASACGLIDQGTPMSFIDMLYVQLFHKCKQYASQSPSMGLQFPGFLEAFFMIAQRKYPDSDRMLDSVSKTVTTCLQHLTPSVN